MRIGVFGGTFDPFHNEHKSIIVSAHNELGLDVIIIMPSFLPPHKRGIVSSYEDRRAMVEAGCADLDYVVIDDLEKERGVVNPTCETLPIIKEKYPCDEFFYIMGGDSAKNFPRWIHPEIIASTAKLVVCKRQGSGDIHVAVEEMRRLFRADVRVLEFEGGFVSSSAIKASIMTDLDPYGLSSEVKRVISDRKMYNQFGDIVDRLRSDIPEKTFLHAARTAVYAETFCGLLGLRFEDVFLAGILHDCAKHLTVEMPGVPKPVVHQFLGAERAKERYGVQDELILDAIRYHTTGKPNMTTLGKLIFCADVLEPNRDYPGVNELRETIETDFEKGFVGCVNRSYEHLIEKGGDIYYLTKECLDYYNK